MNTGNLRLGSSRVRKNTIRIKINIISKMITPKEYFFMTKFSFFCSLLVSLLILSSRIFFSVSFCNIHQWERNWKWMRKEEKDKKICRWHVFLHSNSAESLTIIMPFLSSYETQKRKNVAIRSIEKIVWLIIFINKKTSSNLALR